MTDLLASVLAGRVHEVEARLGGHAHRARTQRARAELWRARAMRLSTDLSVARAAVARSERRADRLEAALADARESRDYLRRRLADVTRNTTAGAPNPVEGEGRPQGGKVAAW